MERSFGVGPAHPIDYYVTDPMVRNAVAREDGPKGGAAWSGLCFTETGHERSSSDSYRPLVRTKYRTPPGVSRK